jgi:hypothetical protein
MIGGVTIPPIHLYDTRRRAVVPFEPIHEGKAGIYTCGPTVYGPQHLGNMRSQLMPDLLRRVLLASGYDVTYVTNVTDVGHLVSDADDGDDKVEAAAARTGETVEQITGRWTEQWANDRRRLGCLEPDAIPKATDHIAGQIAMVQDLEPRATPTASTTASTSTPPPSPATPSSPGSTSTTSRPRAGWRTWPTSATRPTSPSGSSRPWASPASRSGTRRGVGASRAGTSSAR